MSEKSRRELVTTVDQAFDNIRRFQHELSTSPKLRSRLSYVQSWYAIRDSDDGWIFAPSKFIGYKNNTAKKYINFTSPPFEYDGRETERALEDWFETVDSQTRLGRELHQALEKFLAVVGKKPGSRARVNLSKSELFGGAAFFGAIEARRDYMKRITSDPAICGGRPCIKGTRMRVSDILQMMAEGATRDEIREDFPYLTLDDISAALVFAASASNHRVVQAA